MTVGHATVGVMGSSRDEHETLARPLGALLAGLGVNLLTGGGRGVMTSVSRAFLEARRGPGVSIGILPCESLEQRQLTRYGSPNPWIEMPIRTHLPLRGIDGEDDLSRNHINILSSDAIVALPGSSGTASEIELAIRYQKPVLIFARTRDEVRHFNATIERVYALADVERFVVAHTGTRPADARQPGSHL